MKQEEEEEEEEKKEEDEEEVKENKGHIYREKMRESYHEE